MKKKKINKRKAQGAETKQRIYDIAERLFTERDYTEVSVEDITDEAGITKGAFYVHFESKDALISLLLADYAARADTDYKTFLEGLPSDMPAPEALLALIGKIADVLAGTFGYDNMKKTYQMLLAGTTGPDAVKGYNRELYTLLNGILEKGIQRGEFNSILTAETLARHFIMAFRGITYEWCIRHPDFDLREQALSHFRLLLDGISKKPVG